MEVGMGGPWRRMEDRMETGRSMTAGLGGGEVIRLGGFVSSTGAS